MIKNYFKIAFRNLMRYKFISGINLFGLTIGITCCLLILAYVVNELSFDKYNPKSDNIYRIERTFINSKTREVSLTLGTIAPPFAAYLLNDFKEIKKLTRLLATGTTAFKYEEKMFNEPDVYFADENLFSMFKVDMLKGNPQMALSDPYSVLLSEEVAAKYFGSTDPMEKMIKLDNQLSCKVTGVYKAFPSNAHLHPAVMISFNTLNDSTVYGERNLQTNWGNNSFFTYVELPANYDKSRFEAQLPAFQNRHIPTNGNDGTKPSDYSRLTLKKLTDIHLNSHTDYEAEENGDIKRVYIFSSIALFILLIACINYMNLATARSALRAKEIGVRKVAGAGRPELIAQFLSESLVVAWLATLIGIGLTAVTLPLLNKVSGQHLSVLILFKWQILLSLFIVPFIIGILSGIYPALFLSSFQPIHVLKGMIKTGGLNISFRKVLVVVQFSISIILIVATGIVLRQLKYIQNRSLGYNKEHVITMGYPRSLVSGFEAFRNQLLSGNVIKSVARSSRVPTGRLLDAMNSQLNNGDSLEPSKADIKYVVVDEGYLPTYGIKTVAGRSFSKEFRTDSAAFVINEAAVTALGLKSNNDAIDRQFQYGGRKGRVIGVMNDFHFESLHQKIRPIVFFLQKQDSDFGWLSIKIAGNDIKTGLAQVEKAWHTFAPDTPYDFSFLDSRFDRLYKTENQQAAIFTIFSFIAIFIACLGLLGLSAFSISQRVKEIGIRKVLGASSGAIVAMLSKDFLRLVLIAALIAFPLSWITMDQWLQDFAYHASIGWWIFVFAGLIAAAVAFFTISFQAIRAANANPVKNLRAE